MPIDTSDPWRLPVLQWLGAQFRDADADALRPETPVSDRRSVSGACADKTITDRDQRTAASQRKASTAIQPPRPRG